MVLFPSSSSVEPRHSRRRSGEANLQMHHQLPRQNNVLFDNQFGFRKGWSTDLAFQTLSEKFYEAAETYEYMIGIFVISRKRLIQYCIVFYFES